MGNYGALCAAGAALLFACSSSDAPSEGGGDGGTSADGSSSSTEGGSDAGVPDKGEDKCWVVWSPSPAGTCIAGTQVCAGGGFAPIACPDGHTYSAACVVAGGGQCNCSCRTDSSDSGTPCSQPSYDCSTSPPARNQACSDQVGSPAGCGFPAQATGATEKSCCSDAECPSFLPACAKDYGRCTKAGTYPGGHECPDAGSAGPTCTTHTECAADKVCDGSHCVTRNCRDKSACPDGYSCPSGICTR